MPKQHWLESFFTKEGESKREDIVWKAFSYNGWELELSGVASSGIWNVAEATYKKQYHNSFIYHHHEIRGHYDTLYALLCHIEQVSAIDRPEDPGCDHSGASVANTIVSMALPFDIKKAVMRRLSMGKEKYGTELTVGWSKALSYLEEEEDDMIAYCVAANKKAYALLLGWLIWLRRKLHDSA